MKACTILCSRKALTLFAGGVVLVGAMGAGLAASRGWFHKPAPAPEIAPEPEKVAEASPRTEPPKGPSSHPPIVAFRDRILNEYHGKAVNRFTNIDGFGMERLIPLYKEIPYEIPHFSTGDIEVASPPPTPGKLQQVFEKSVTEFLSPSPVPVPAKKEEVPWIVNGREGFGGVVRGTVARGLQLRLLDLVGLTDPDEVRVYSGGKAMEVVRMVGKLGKGEARPEFAALQQPFDDVGIVQVAPALRNSPPVPAAKDAAKDAKIEMRSPDAFEWAGVLELRNGKDTFVRHKEKTIRMLGALRATEQCVKCHTGTKEGDLLGAFSYTFVDTTWSLAQDLKIVPPDQR